MYLDDLYRLNKTLTPYCCPKRFLAVPNERMAELWPSTQDISLCTIKGVREEGNDIDLGKLLNLRANYIAGRLVSAHDPVLPFENARLPSLSAVSFFELGYSHATA